MDRRRKIDLDGKWKQVATQAVTREDFKDKLVADPVAVMEEFELRLPEGVDAKVGSDGAVKLFAPEDAPEAVLEEVQWWKWRLDIIRQFGRQDQKEASQHIVPDGEDDDV